MTTTAHANGEELMSFAQSLTEEQRTKLDAATREEWWAAFGSWRDQREADNLADGMRKSSDVWRDYLAVRDATERGQQVQPRRIRSQRVSEVPLKRRTFLWENRVPLGEITVWAGHAGIGKSQAAVWLASEVSRGRLPGELYGNPASVLYLGTEDSWSYTLAPRFVAAGADLDRVHRLYAETAEGIETVMSLAIDLDELRTEIEATGTRLVVLDALLSTMSGADLVKQGVVRRYLEPVARLAQDLNIAVIGVAHFRKAGGTEPLHMISGSAEFGQVVRSAIGFARDGEADDNSCVMSVIKTNISPQGLPSLRYRIDSAVVDTPEGPTDVGQFVVIGETDRSVGDLIDQQGGNADDRTERDEAAEWLTGYLADQGGTARAADIFKAAKADGIAEATLKRARKRAGVTSERQGYGQGSVWSIDPFGSRSAHSDQGVRADPNGLNGDPNGETSSCRTCGEPAKAWVLQDRGGQCITCSRSDPAA